MSGGGCKTCPVKGCDAQYRGSQCAALRAKAGVDSDPMTNADRIRAMSDEELAEFLAKRGVTQAVLRLRDDGFSATPEQKNALESLLYKTWMDWLQQPAQEASDEADS